MIRAYTSVNMWDKNINLASDFMFQDIFSFGKEKEGSLKDVQLCYFCNRFFNSFFTQGEFRALQDWSWVRNDLLMNKLSEITC